MDGIKISVTKFEDYIRHTSDHVYFGILKREFWATKATVSEWKQIIQSIKQRPAN